MSTKFRQSFGRLCGGCNASSKSQHASAVLFCKGYTMRPMLMSINRDGLGGTMSTTTRLPYRPTNISQLHEKKRLLTDNTPTPITTVTINHENFIFP
ncbi:unnamed protein product [Rotaria sp. Silwood2]|nr:unnamed protein product [Rotaria sp. Silwood2]CAF2580306.1 unnamed protein product [Rotaria sp. Silwood2]CAF2839741.1 unnamed protein product [Rotaria sp. Silwood2]CAF2988355.1 unnamed protein product [Rotaria sp. Silwood2]CAF3954966.1 unnamed protein product [Rotaria sp. Silwood2]